MLDTVQAFIRPAESLAAWNRQGAASSDGQTCRADRRELQVSHSSIKVVGDKVSPAEIKLHVHPAIAIQAALIFIRNGERWGRSRCALTVRIVGQLVACDFPSSPENSLPTRESLRGLRAVAPIQLDRILNLLFALSR